MEEAIYKENKIQQLYDSRHLFLPQSSSQELTKQVIWALIYELAFMSANYRVYTMINIVMLTPPVR